MTLSDTYLTDCLLRLLQQQRMHCQEQGYISPCAPNLYRFTYPAHAWTSGENTMAQLRLLENRCRDDE